MPYYLQNTPYWTEVAQDKFSSFRWTGQGRPSVALSSAQNGIRLGKRLRLIRPVKMTVQYPKLLLYRVPAHFMKVGTPTQCGVKNSREQKEHRQGSGSDRSNCNGYMHYQRLTLRNPGDLLIFSMQAVNLFSRKHPQPLSKLQII
jgi:hypothetical protein